MVPPPGSPHHQWMQQQQSEGMGPAGPPGHPPTPMMPPVPGELQATIFIQPDVQNVDSIIYLYFKIIFFCYFILCFFHILLCSGSVRLNVYPCMHLCATMTVQ